MIAIISGDIINSRKIEDASLWMNPLKKLLKEMGSNPIDWEITRGDFFQVRVENPTDALFCAIKIKALIKSLESEEKKQSAKIDVRLAIGVGSENYKADRISESNGQAYIFSGENFELLKPEKVNLSIKTQWSQFDKTMNLLLKFASIVMDDWTISSAELQFTVLKNLTKTQTEIGEILNIKQNSVSERWSRAKIDEILELDEYYRQEIERYIEV